MTSKIERVHIDFSNELNKLWKKNRGELSKITITKQIAAQLRKNSRKQPRYIVNYWPISRKKVKVY